jgi:hypothetical protein
MSNRRAFLTGLAALPLASLPALAADPVFAAIERHKLAVALAAEAMERTCYTVDIPDDLEAACDAAQDAEAKARHDMHAAVPTTLAGLKAYVASWHAYVSDDWVVNEQIGWEAIDTIAEALRGMG